MSPNITRRAVTQGVAWAVPAVSLAVASPAFAASAPACPPASQAAVDAYFARYLAALPDYTGVIIRVRHDQTLLALNGTLQLDYVSFENVGTVDADFTPHPFQMAIDIVTVAGPTDRKRSWNIDGSSTDMGLADGKGVAYPAGRYPNESDFALTNGTQTLYTQLNERLVKTLYDDYGQSASSNQTTTISFQDGATPTTRLNNKVVIRPLGFAAPTPEMVTAATGVDVSPTGLCYQAYYQRAVDWNTNNRSMRGIQFEQVAPNTKTVFNYYDADPSRTVKGTVLDSSVTGNFNSGSAEAVAQDGIF